MLLQVFYGTLPAVLLLVGIALRKWVLLSKVHESVITLETRTGVIYHE